MEIKVNKLSKRYRKKHALNEVSFELTEPKIYGLLGRNGAGKTTFMDILAGYQLPTSGDVVDNNKNPFDNREISQHICIIKEGNNFNRNLKVKHIFNSYSLFYSNWDQAMANELIKEYNLTLNAKVKSLAKGMKSALGVIVGLSS